MAPKVKKGGHFIASGTDTYVFKIDKDAAWPLEIYTTKGVRSVRCFQNTATKFKYDGEPKYVVRLVIHARGEVELQRKLKAWKSRINNPIITNRFITSLHEYETDTIFMEYYRTDYGPDGTELRDGEIVTGSSYMKINDATNEVKYVESLLGEMTEDEKKRFTYKFNSKEKKSIQEALVYDQFEGIAPDWNGIEDFMKWTKAADKDPGQDYPKFWCLVTPLQGPDVVNLTFWDIGTQPSKFTMMIDVLEVLKIISEQSEKNRILHMDTHEENMACLIIDGQWKGILHDPGKLQFVSDRAFFMNELIKLYTETRAVNKTIKRIFSENEKEDFDEPDCSIGDPVIKNNSNKNEDDGLGTKMVEWLKKSDGNYARFTKSFDIIHVLIMIEEALYINCKRETEDFAPRKDVTIFYRVIVETIHNLCRDVMDESESESESEIDKLLSRYIYSIKSAWTTLEQLPASRAAAAALQKLIEEEKAEQNIAKASRQKRYNNYTEKLKAARLEKLAKAASEGGRRSRKSRTKKLRR
jgi:hypothetical protein